MKLIMKMLIITCLFAVQVQAQDAPVITLEYPAYVVDTIITFNPDTQEESVQIIRRPGSTEQLEDDRLDTWNIKVSDEKITYSNRKTGEEKIFIINEQSTYPQELTIPDLRSDSAEMPVDTIIIYDPVTKEESVHIIRRKRN